MQCPSLSELPPPPPGKSGWPWTEESPRLPLARLDGKTWPRVSVVTASFNHGDHIEETIRSILLQGYPDIEYIVMDGGSTDSTAMIMEKYDRWIAYRVSAKDNGPGPATSQGLNRASGALLGMMPADDFYQRGAMAELVNLAVVHSDCVLWAGCADEIDLAGKPIRRLDVMINDQAAIGNWFENYFPTVGCLMSKEAYVAAKGINEDLFPRYATDIDLMIRLAKTGRFHQSDLSVAYVRMNPGSVSRTNALMNGAAMISSNYINGDPEVAGLALLGFTREWVQHSENLVRTARVSVLLKALVGRFCWSVGVRLRALAGSR